jgi:hypothetical protein
MRNRVNPVSHQRTVPDRNFANCVYAHIVRQSDMAIECAVRDSTRLRSLLSSASVLVIEDIFPT